MLTRQQALAQLQGQQLLPDRLSRSTHKHYLAFAERMLRVYEHGQGLTRRELHQAVERIFAAEGDCPVRRIGAFCKLLDEKSEFDSDQRGAAAELRQQVFSLAAAHHPLVTNTDSLFESSEEQTKANIAAQLGRSWEAIDAELFADVMEFHRLKSCSGYPSPQALLSRYNVAQTQVALFDAEQITIQATSDLKVILRYAKLARLMHRIRRISDECYELQFDGPASLLRQTRRYGVSMAKFLPALLACRGWKLHARLRTGRVGWMVYLALTDQDGLVSHLPPPEEFDSQLEANFAQRWEAEPHDGWTLSRESEILYCGQKVFIPDFVFTHTDGRRHLLEIVGFWTPEYLQAKVETLQLFKEHRIMLAVAESAQDKFPSDYDDMIYYKTALRVRDVLAMLNRAEV